MANDFTVADVLEWARTKPADERYDYDDNRNCALCYFLRETGRAARPSVAPDRWSDNHKRYYELDAVLNDAVQGVGDFYRPDRWTFGALVKRLEAIVQEAPSIWTDPQTYLDAEVGEIVS